MGIVDDIMKTTLDRIPIWKRLGTVPSEVDDLKRRIGEIEKKLSGKWPPDICRFCGERHLERHSRWPQDRVATFLECIRQPLGTNHRNRQQHPPD